MVFGERLSLLVELKHQKVVRRARDPRCDVEMAVSGDSHGGTLNPSLLAPRNDSPQWRVLVIEDADELLREDAKSRVGQVLSRLLNLGDGILGQGLRVIVLMNGVRTPTDASNSAAALSDSYSGQRRSIVFECSTSTNGPSFLLR